MKSRPLELEAFLVALDGPQPEGFAERLFKALLFFVSLVLSISFDLG